VVLLAERLDEATMKTWQQGRVGANGFVHVVLYAGGSPEQGQGFLGLASRELAPCLLKLARQAQCLARLPMAKRRLRLL
jgi:hypothetical protein